jgi:metal-responsive CopG/Arc/MetJ family transcriptional regulator
MTSTTISVKLPARLLEEIPAAGNGRSAFIMKAIEEKLARRKSEQWKPKTARGERMAALLRKGKTERLPLLSEAEVERELAMRRGREF